MVHDFSKDDNLSASDLLALAERYHAFSGSSLQSYTLPTAGAVSSYAGDVEVVQPDAAAALITQFLGGPFGTILTPPINQYGNPLTLTVPPTTTTLPVTDTVPATTAHPASSTGTTTVATPGNGVPSFDPTPC